MNGQLPERYQTAMERCSDAIGWYDKHKGLDRWAFYATQTLAISLGALAPVAVVSLPELKWLHALLPALGAIAAGLGASFGFRENWVRFGVTEELLKSERAKFQTRTTPPYATTVADEVALSNFVDRVEAIVLSEATQWKAGLQDDKGETATVPS